MIFPATLIAAALFLGHLGYAEVSWWANALLALWLWCFGANVGSFMNVVVYRLPAGISVVHPGSRCPFCEHPIRWYDNIPVVSWLILRARCRDCQAPIAIRYPVVEGTVAAVFLVLAFIEPIPLGINLPTFERGSQWEAIPMSMSMLRVRTMLTLWLIYLYQLLLWCTLVCAALMRFDRRRPPRRLYIPAAVVGLVAPMIWISLRPVAYGMISGGEHWYLALIEGLMGLVAGMTLGVLLVRLPWESSLPIDDEVFACLGITGLILGWQAVSLLACLAAVSVIVTNLLGARWPGFRRLSFVAFLAIFTPIFIAGWRWIVELAPWLGPRASLATFALSAVTMIALGFFGDMLLSAVVVRRRRARHFDTNVKRESQA